MNLRDALILQAPSLALQRAAADEIARLDVLLASDETALKALAFDNLVTALQGRHEVVHRFVRSALPPPQGLASESAPTNLVFEEEHVDVVEWRFRIDVVGGNRGLEDLLLSAARKKAGHA